MLHSLGPSLVGQPLTLTIRPRPCAVLFAKIFWLDQGGYTIVVVSYEKLKAWYSFHWVISLFPERPFLIITETIYRHLSVVYKCVHAGA